MNSTTVLLASLVTLAFSTQCFGEDPPAVIIPFRAEYSQSLTKQQYLFKAYVLRERVALPEGFTGTWRTWHRNGKPQSEQTLVNGSAHGPAREWDEWGQLIASGEYRKGDPYEGSFRSCFSWIGQCYSIQSYTSGRPDGPFSVWTAFGGQLVKGQYTHDQKTGLWQWWDETGKPIARGKYKDGRPWSGTFAIRVENKTHVEEYQAGENLEIVRIMQMPFEELSKAVTDPDRHQTLRWKVTRELAKRKDPLSKPLLIKLLKDENVSVRGSAAWGLSQIGGEDAQDALLEYLRVSLVDRSWGDLTRATEAQKELPDKRALVLLIDCLKLSKDQGTLSSYTTYAAEALGKIGDPEASLPLAQLLDLNTDYSMSCDSVFLKAIADTGGQEATAILVDYLVQLVVMMRGQSLEKFETNVGAEFRKVSHNHQLYGLARAALSAVTGRQSIQGSREEVARDWQQWWQKKSRKL